MIGRMPDRSLREVKTGADLRDWRVRIDQGLEFGTQGDVRHRSILWRLGRKPVALRQGLHDRSRDLVVQPADDVAAFDLGWTVVDRQQIARIAEQLFDGGLLGPLGGAVVARGAWVPLVD